MTLSTQQYLRETIDLLVLEILGKFNFSEFKKIAMTSARPKEPRGKKPWDLPKEYTTHPELEYAKRFLPELGSGSSRTTFALSGGKVLKIAMNNAGIAQNKEELDVFTRLRNNSLVTKIFDYSPDYKWLVSEIVKPLANDNNSEEFEKYVGVPGYSFWALYREIKIGGDPRDWINGKIDELKRRIEEYKHDLEFEKTENFRRTYEQRIDRNNEEIESWQNLLKNSFAINFAREIVDFVNKSGLHEGDVTRPDHFGRTVDGQIKLLDYGFSHDIDDKFYKNRPANTSAEPGDGGGSGW